MRNYSTKISLCNNSRGMVSIDPIMGCYYGTIGNKNGCYNGCYACKISRGYGYDFTKPILRGFENGSHVAEILHEINKVKLPFIRMGTMGDPSHDWDHTLNICEILQNKAQLKLFELKQRYIVIVTKHWTRLTDSQLKRVSKLNLCFNTSVSPLDGSLLSYRLNEFKRLQQYCKSSLRLVSFNFTDKGGGYDCVQNEILKTHNAIETIFRSSKNNPLVTDGIINIERVRFLGGWCYASVRSPGVYFGDCNNCPELCGVN